MQRDAALRGKECLRKVFRFRSRKANTARIFQRVRVQVSANRSHVRLFRLAGRRHCFIVRERFAHEFRLTKANIVHPARLEKNY